MLNSVRFECTTLGTKAGVLKPDKDGYYTMPVGGLNVFNSAGQYYAYERARSLFEESSQFMRRVRKGVLYGEQGHPIRESGMSNEEYVRRVLTIRESNVCCFHQSIWLDFDSVKDSKGMPVIAIMSKVCPAGPLGEALRRDLETPGKNVAFSIRAFTIDRIERGTTIRDLDTIVTFDRVIEPGIEFATKFDSPAMECYSEAEVLSTTRFTRGEVERAIYDAPKGIATESTLLTAKELLASLGWSTTAELPAYTDW